MKYMHQVNNHNSHAKLKTTKTHQMASTKYEKGQTSDNRYNNEDGNGDDGSEYLIVKPRQGGIRDLFKYLAWADMDSGMKFLEGSDEGLTRGMAADNRFIIIVSIIARKILAFFGRPLRWIGCLVDFFLNLLSLNGYLPGLIHNILHAKVVIPQRGSENFLSTIGQLDGRIDLYKIEDLMEKPGDTASGDGGIKEEPGNRALMDLCIMASKLAYENDKVVKNVVVHNWKMHFVNFYDCWNDFQKQMSTQVFILCDKPKDATLVLISFRGTEPFDADDWGTDFDYSWYEIPELGKIHMGFLEALGLGNRTKADTFQSLLRLNDMENTVKTGPAVVGKIEDGTQLKSSSSNFDGEQNGSKQTSGFEESAGGKWIPPEMAKKSAYYVVRKKLKALLEKHKNAKFVVTGHSLGGALAIMFPTVLVLHDEMELMQRMLAVYTFGQPRIGNRQLGKFMEIHLNFPEPKYFRVVYCNDLVPRLPYDDRTFLYKHFGVCVYYDIFYNEQKLQEEPNPNYGLRYLVPVYLNAVWELIRSFTMGYMYGPEYEEGWFSISLRVLGLALPGISAHSPTNYVNSVRLGRQGIVEMSAF